MATAHPHATGEAVYPALFLFSRMHSNIRRSVHPSIDSFSFSLPHPFSFHYNHLLSTGEFDQWFHLESLLEQGPEELFGIFFFAHHAVDVAETIEEAPQLHRPISAHEEVGSQRIDYTLLIT